MAKEYAKDFYNSQAWKKTRKAYYVYRRGQCERCAAEFEAGKRSLEDINAGYIVHHKEYITPDNLHDPRVALSFDNLELLCEEHHNKEHKSKTKRYSFDANGRVIEA